MTDKSLESPIHGYVTENVKLSRDVALFIFIIRYLDKPEYCFSLADPSYTVLFPILPLLALAFSPPSFTLIGGLHPSLRNKYLNF